jgi:hypothetical protein
VLWNTGLPGAQHRRAVRAWAAGGRQAAATSIAARPGAHQSDRRLYLATEQKRSSTVSSGRLDRLTGLSV